LLRFARNDGSGCLKSEQGEMAGLVMAGLVPAIHVFLLRDGLEKIHAEMPQDVDGRDKPGHDGG
jgi:hypothetical protein